VLMQGFFSRVLPACGVLISTGIGDVPAGFGHTRTASTACVRCILGGVAVRRAPEPGPVRGDWGKLSDLFCTHPRRPFAGRRARFPQPPSVGSRIADSSLSCYRVIQVDVHAPFDEGWLVVRRLVHESACMGLLGGAQSRSLGTEGVEALPRWDPPDLLPSLALEHEMWGALKPVGSRIGSNVRALVVPDSVDLGRLFEPFEG
jgi:hypothetical protein